MNNVLLYFSLKYNGDWDQIYLALENKEKISYQQLDKVSKKIKCNYLTILDKNYPEFLKNVYKPPFVIFYIGDIFLLSKYKKNLSVVGGTKVDKSLLTSLKSITLELNKEKIAFSTFEKDGINNEFLDQALENNLPIVEIIKGDIKSYMQKTINCKPRKNVLVISEIYEFGDCLTENDLENLYRLISALSNGILFADFCQEDDLEALFKYAIREGKEAFTFLPYKQINSNADRLIKEGAKIIKNAKDIINDL